MDQKRIKTVIDVERMANCRAMIVGLGGSMTITEGLVRCGIGAVTTIDPDTVDASNLARQGHSAVGEKKVRAAGKHFQKINPNLDYLGIGLRHDQIPDEHWKELMADTDLLILATDSFEAQAFGNRLALSSQTPAMWIGMYSGANAGEIVWWTPESDDCFRCLLERRYFKQETIQADPESDGALMQDLHIVDGIGGHIALGLLTRCCDGYFGQLIGMLGKRQFLQVKLRHDWLLDGIDPVAKALSIDEQNDAYFCWNTVARQNGPRLAACPDCEELLGRTFEDDEFIAVEVSSEVTEEKPEPNETNTDLSL